MRERFLEVNFDADSMEVLRWVNQAMESFKAQGHRVSVRQMFYFGVSSNLIPNTQASYNRVKRIINDGRMGGFLDWDVIEDRNRSTDDHVYWNSTDDALHYAIEKFKTDKWIDQPCHVEVFLEKAALEGIIAPICRKFEVPFTASRGFSSSSLMYEAGKRLQSQFIKGKQIHVLAFYDHDPSGLDMTRVLRDRLLLLSDQSPVNVHRLALNMDQIEALHLPENPVKMTDSRSPAYIERFGHHCYELDALPIAELEKIISDGIRAFRDEGRWEKQVLRQEQMREDANDHVFGEEKE